VPQASTIFFDGKWAVWVRPKRSATKQTNDMKDASDEQKAIARECANVPDGVAKLKRAGLSEGCAILLIAKHNTKAYNAWREQPITQPKPSDTARQPGRFAFKGA